MREYPVPFCQYFEISFLRPFAVTNVTRNWVQFSTVTEVWLFEETFEMAVVSLDVHLDSNDYEKFHLTKNCGVINASYSIKIR